MQFYAALLKGDSSCKLLAKFPVKNWTKADNMASPMVRNMKHQSNAMHVSGRPKCTFTEEKFGGVE